MLTSAGNLLTTYALDSLADRRSALSIWGCGDNPSAADLVRLDRFIQVPSSADEEAWIAGVSGLLDSGDIDLVVPCSERDVSMVASLAARDTWKTQFAAGPRWFADMLADKRLTSDFAKANGLPFAQTACTTSASFDSELEELIRNAGFPLIAKPQVGFASRGVRFIVDRQQLKALLQSTGPMVFQQYLSTDPLPREMYENYEAGFPLWQEEPDGRTFGLQAVIGPHGEVAGTFTFQARNELGKTWWLSQFEDARLESVGLQWVDAAAAAGWRGVLNVQTRLNADGYTPVEVAGRISGGLSARFLCGFDELGLLVGEFLGHSLPSSPRQGSATEVVRVYRDIEPWVPR